MRWTNKFASITLQRPVSTPVILTKKKIESYLTHFSPRFKSLFKIQLDCSNAQRWDGPIHLRQSLLKAASFERQLRLLMSRRVRAYIIRLDKVTAHHTAELSLPLFVSLQKETFTIQKIKCRKKCCALFCYTLKRTFCLLLVVTIAGDHWLSNFPRP